MEYNNYVDSSYTYNLVTIEDNQVEEHCSRYMDSITGFFHASEITHQLNLMKEAVATGLALAVVVDKKTIGFLYMVPVGKIRGNVVVLYSETPEAKAILVHELYKLGLILRYTPRDPVCNRHIELLQKVSYKMFQMNRVEFIKMLLEFDSQLALTNLHLREL